MYKIQEVFRSSFKKYAYNYTPSVVQNKAAYDIMNCKSGKIGSNISICDNCGHKEYHHNSCRNRNCPCCQKLIKEIWIDSRKAEVIDAPYYHVIFTLPKELRSLIYQNQYLLYSLMHKVVSRTLLELAQDKKYLGGTPGIIQVLHTWGRKLNYHPHLHCIVTGGGLTETKKFVKKNNKFFIPIKVIGKVFRGKFLCELQKLYEDNMLEFSNKCKKLKNSYEWKEFRNNLYKKDWIPYIKETFNGNGNAIEYLGRYANHVAISNSRIIKSTEKDVTFKAKDYKTNKIKEITLNHVEFIRRFMMHILPKGFQKIRYYGFLNNRYKKANLKTISRLTGKELYKSKFGSLSKSEVLKEIWGIELTKCPVCKKNSMRDGGKSYNFLN